MSIIDIEMMAVVREKRLRRILDGYILQVKRKTVLGFSDFFFCFLKLISISIIILIPLQLTRTSFLEIKFF